MIYFVLAAVMLIALFLAILCASKDMEWTAAFFTGAAGLAFAAMIWFRLTGDLP